MKTKILIVEDNPYKFFTLKQLLESQLRIPVEARSSELVSEVCEFTAKFSPQVLICRPIGGVLEVLEKLKLRGVNRRNTTLVLALTTELSRNVVEKLFQVADIKITSLQKSLIARAD